MPELFPRIQGLRQDIICSRTFSLAQGNEGVQINKYEGGAGENGSGIILDFDYIHDGDKDSVGVLQTVVTDTFRDDVDTPYSDPESGGYYDDYINMVPRPDPEDLVYNFDTQSFEPGFKMVPSRENGILRFQDAPANPASTNRYGELRFVTRIVNRADNSTIRTIKWGYSNTPSGFTLFKLRIE